jgi:peptide/nickel transport system permease protein
MLTRYTLRRALTGLLQVLAVATLVFAFTEALPGDAAIAAAGDDPDPARIAVLRHQFGLDRPVLHRYGDWLTGLCTGDLGTSLHTGSQVSSLLADAAGPTLALSMATLAILMPASLAFGIGAAVRAGGRLDRAISASAVAMHAVPEYALAVLLVAVFALWLGLLPPTAVAATPAQFIAEPALLVLPVTVLVARSAASLIRQLRAGMLDALASDYVAHARRHGLSRARVLLGHALPNAAAPAVQQLARTVDWLFGGVIVVEAVFAIPGLSAALVNAVASRDVPVVQGVAVLIATIAVGANLFADVIAYRLAPRAGLA